MPRLNHQKINVQGIPENLDVLKCTEVVPVKLPDEVKKAIPKPASEWIRGLIYAEINKQSKN